MADTTHLRAQRRWQLTGSLGFALLLTIGTALAVGAVVDTTRADAVTDEGGGRRDGDDGRGGNDNRGRDDSRGRNQGRG